MGSKSIRSTVGSQLNAPYTLLSLLLITSSPRTSPATPSSPPPPQSDILQVPVQRPHFQETTALGAALAAGYTVGFWDMAFVAEHPPGDATTFTPEASKEAAARRFKHWKKAVGRCLDLADLAT